MHKRYLLAASPLLVVLRPYEHPTTTGDRALVFYGQRPGGLAAGPTVARRTTATVVRGGGRASVLVAGVSGASTRPGEHLFRVLIYMEGSTPYAANDLG